MSISRVLTTSILRPSCGRFLEAGKDCSVFDMPIPMFDLRASAASAGLAHEEKIFSVCSLDGHHSASSSGENRTPIYTTPKTNPSFDGVWRSSLAQGFGLRDGVCWEIVCVCVCVSVFISRCEEAML